MRDTSGVSPHGASWDDLRDELFDGEDRAEIERRAERLRAEVRAYRPAEIRKRRQTKHASPTSSAGSSPAAR